jgi:hypothetical protein
VSIVPLVPALITDTEASAPAVQVVATLEPVPRFQQVFDAGREKTPAMRGLVLETQARLAASDRRRAAAPRLDPARATAGGAHRCCAVAGRSAPLRSLS